MNEPNTNVRKRRNFIWPNIETIDDAKWATKQAMVAATLCASITGLCAILAICGVEFVRKTLQMSGASLIDAAIFGLIAVFLAKQSRFAAWSGLLVYLFERVVTWSTVPGSQTSFFMPLIFTMAFVTGVRGAHAYHRLQGATPPEGQQLAA